MLIRNSFSVLRLVFLLRIHRQKDAITECGLKPFNRAILIPATARAAADTDGADHLAVNDDGNTARVCKESELHQLPWLSARIISQLSGAVFGLLDFAPNLGARQAHPYDHCEFVLASRSAFVSLCLCGFSAVGNSSCLLHLRLFKAAHADGEIGPESQEMVDPLLSF
jgi:hypothetical protein